MLSPITETVDFGNSFLTVPLFHSCALPLVCDRATSLKRLVLCDETSPKSKAARYWDPLIKLAIRLRELEIRLPLCATPNVDTLPKLCMQLKNITSLTLDVHTASHQPSDSTLSQDDVLPALQELHITHRSGVIKLCPCYPSFLVDRATSMAFHLKKSVTGSDAFKGTIDVLSKNRSLRTVKLHGPEYFITPGVVVAFLEQLSLEELQFDVLALKQTKSLDPDRKIVQSLVKAASSNDPATKFRLESLSLPLRRHLDPLTRNVFDSDSELDSSEAEYTSLSSLVLIAQHVKTLYYLSLPIDSSKVGGGRKSITPIIRSWKEPETPSPLMILEIADMRDRYEDFKPSEYRDIAWLLDLVFPNLRMVRMARGSKCWVEHWELIEEHRQMMRTIRLGGGRYH
ncbi:hypothetical protein MD484_g6888, partial [Candolleomyces efflorescens]